MNFQRFRHILYMILCNVGPIVDRSTSTILMLSKHRDACFLGDPLQIMHLATIGSSNQVIIPIQIIIFIKIIKI